MMIDDGKMTMIIVIFKIRLDLINAMRMMMTIMVTVMMIKTISSD